MKLQLTFFFVLLATIALVQALPFANNKHNFSKSAAAIVKQVSPDVFSCDSADPVIRAVCKEGLGKFNSELSKAGISIDSGNFIFNYDDPDDESIPTGHSCTVRAEMQHKHISAKISSSSRLDISGNALTEPLAVRVELPVSLQARVDIKQRFGVRLIFGRCSTVGSDSYSLKASVGTVANIVVGFFLNPSLAVMDTGEYVLKIEPKLAVMSAISNTKLNFEVSGVSPVSGVLTRVLGFSSTVLKSATALLNGESVSEIVLRSIPFDFGVPVLLGIGILPQPIETSIWNQILKRRATKEAKGFVEDLGDKLSATIGKALKLDSDGKRVLIVKKETVDRLRAGTSISHIFESEPTSRDPSADCYRALGELCTSCDYCRQCEDEEYRCQQISEDFFNRYGRFFKAKFVPAIPKVASISTPTPAPRVDNRSPYQKCIDWAYEECDQCGGSCPFCAVYDFCDAQFGY